MTFPDDKMLYDMFEEQGRQMLPESLMPHFGDDIHDLVNSVKEVLRITLAANPEASIDTKSQVIFKLEVWRNTQTKNLEYSRYLEFAEGNNFNEKVLSFYDFVDTSNYRKWEKIKELGLKKGSKIRVKGYGDIYTVKGISAYLTVAVEELPDTYFNLDQIVSVVN